MKNATIVGLIALLALTTSVFAAPALSTSSSKEITVQGLARQVRVLRTEVKALRGQVAAARKAIRNAQLTDAALFRKADNAEQMAIAANGVAQRLDGCLNHVLPMTRFNGYWYGDPAVFTTALDLPDAGDPTHFYVALVESTCAGGFVIAARPEAHAR